MQSCVPHQIQLNKMFICSDEKKDDRVQCAVYSLLPLHHTLAAVHAAVNQQLGVIYQQFLKAVVNFPQEKKQSPCKVK